MIFHGYAYQHMQIIAKFLPGSTLKFGNTCGALTPGVRLNFSRQLMGMRIFFYQVKEMKAFGRVKRMTGNICYHPEAFSVKGISESSLDRCS